MLPLNVINHILQHNPQVCQRLSAYNGMVVGLHGDMWQIRARIGSDGLFSHTQRQADVTFSCPPQVLGDLLRNRHIDWQQINIQGDTELAYFLLAEWSTIRYTPQQDLSRIFGETQAKRINQYVVQAAQSLHFLAQLLQFQATETQANQPSHENEQALHEALQTIRHENAILQCEIKHLNRRIQYLEQVAFKHRLPENQ
ncbi:MAG: hypothetical protein Q4B82_04215 [Alysiella sp.]|uniref:hypothetical protein n=1 Tax=Alysiella sp. TaxID=1872483 RepID=UPI0026DB2B25|nr:hypothetical protein [Alysiella sp.]MDO4433766.1 hypothetical protein [Alysiella sp.]